MSGISDRNPFVGPRPIQQGEALHGREAEVRELYNRLQARRIVVLHSPSGAGKSSLVQAGLIPRLRAGHFDVWKPIRVNLDPSELEGIPAGTNRYLLSAMVSLEDELPPAHRRAPAQLASMSFREYIETRPRRKGRADDNVVLLFDQFEEVLTAAPLAVDAKQELFTEIGRALDDERYWALFIVREDYLAAFTPYRDRVPTQLGNTFRLDLLGLDGAREAAVALAERGGRSFPAVDRLIRELSTVRTQRADGSFVTEQDVHIEPVHLQVVCRRLWEAMPEDDLSIDPEDIEAYASVSEALAGYYSDAVASIAHGDLAIERRVRDWVGHQLIVGGIRSQVRQEAGTTAGLANEHITALLDSYLVRTEQRAGANWFELSHDRLVDPVLEDNEQWEQAHLHPLQVQAKLWEDGKRARALLLRGEAIREAKAWAKDNPDRLTPAEKEFLEQSVAFHRETRRRRRMQVALTAFATLAAIVSLVLFFDAKDKERKAVEATAAAEQAKSDAEEAKADADVAKADAEQQRDQATAAQKRAEAEKERNLRLQRKDIETAMRLLLRDVPARVASEGAVWGALTLHDGEWMRMLSVQAHVLVAARFVHDGKGRIIAAGHDQILYPETSSFPEYSLDWLLGDSKKRKVLIFSQDPARGGARGFDFGALVQSLKTVQGYTFQTDIELGHPVSPADLSQVGVVIVANRWVPAFEPGEVEALDGFLRAGGGMLVVGSGWSWKDYGPEAPYEDTSRYPVNVLLRRHGVEWNEELVSQAGFLLAATPDETVWGDELAEITFQNDGADTIEVLWESAPGVERLAMALPPGAVEPADTWMGHSWIVRRASDRAHLKTVEVDARERWVTIGEPPAGGVPVAESGEPDWGDQYTTVEFMNTLPLSIEVYWQPPEGEEKLAATIPAEDIVAFDAWMGDTWVVRDPTNGQELVRTVIQDYDQSVAL